MGISQASVEEWLDTNNEWVQEYFLKKADLMLVNKWLVSRGYPVIHDFLPESRRNSAQSQDSSGHTSPEMKCSDSVFFNEVRDAKHYRSNSRKHLRQDFARSKRRSMFRTCDSTSSISSSTTESRRSSLKDMRQFLSLPSSSVNMLSILIQSKVRLPRYASKDEEIKRELRDSDDKEFFLEIVKDISHDLDLKSLSGKILMNLCILLDADRSSLFLVEGPKGKQNLVSKVFDAYSGTQFLPCTSKGDNVVKIPWGKGIIGHVADTGHCVNITKANKDPRYQDDIDRMLGDRSECLLCMPVRNADDEIIGVAQVINKSKEGQQFSKDDEQLMETYLTFCGMAMSNAQAIEAYTREYDRNKALLEVVHDLFEEQTSVDAVVTKIMHRARTLLKCDRCTVLLKDPKSENPGFSKVFDVHQPTKNGQTNRSGFRDLCRHNKIAEIVASTGETINIPDTQNDGSFDLLRDIGCFARSVLCKPIRNNNQQTIGVAQLINKTDGSSFDDNDDQLFEAFTIFCGLGINNCLLYDEVARAAATQAVAIEVLSYHASVNNEDFVSMKSKPIPEANHWSLSSLDFNDFSLTTDEMIQASIRIFKDMGLIKEFQINYDTLCRWLLTVRKNYRNVAYHNWRHAFNVCQFMFALLSSTSLQRHLDDVEILSLIVGCLCHDLDHRGTNNAFQQKTSSPLSQLYGTQATLEHHHFNHAVMILNSEGHNIFANLSSDDYSRVMNLLKQSILATDLSLHIQVRSKFFPLIESGYYNWDDPEQRELLRSILMTSCDIATITKPWDVQRKAADLVVTEFFQQGDKERTVLKIQPQALMDRERQDELPRLQLEWVDGIGYPLYKALSRMDQKLEPLLERVLDNRAHWGKLDEQRLAKTMNVGIQETDV